MSKTRIGQKAIKTGTLLIGVRDARIAKQLRPYGYSAETLEEGWNLFMEVTGQRLDRVMSRPARRPDLVTELAGRPRGEARSPQGPRLPRRGPSLNPTK